MPETDLNDILKNGDSFELHELNLSAKRTIARFKKVRKLQNISEERKILDWDKLEAFRVKSI